MKKIANSYRTTGTVAGLSGSSFPIGSVFVGGATGHVRLRGSTDDPRLSLAGK